MKKNQGNFQATRAAALPPGCGSSPPCAGSRKRRRRWRTGSGGALRRRALLSSGGALSTGAQELCCEGGAIAFRSTPCLTRCASRFICCIPSHCAGCFQRRCAGGSLSVGQILVLLMGRQWSSLPHSLAPIRQIYLVGWPDMPSGSELARHHHHHHHKRGTRTPRRARPSGPTRTSRIYGQMQTVVSDNERREKGGNSGEWRLLLEKGGKLGARALHCSAAPGMR